MRNRLHARVADRFEAVFDPAETGGLLSLHFFLAGKHEKALQYAKQAAQRAGDQFAHHEAAQLYQRAIDLSPELGDDVYFKLGNIAYKRNEREQASELWRRALELNPKHELVKANLETLSSLS